MFANARLPALVLAAAVCLLLGETGYQLTLNANLAREHQASAQQLDGLALSLEATLSRHESCPASWRWILPC